MQVVYSELFNLEEISTSHPAIRNCPIFAQEYIEKLYEYRVMMIGKEIHTCRIDSQASEKTKVDWRHYDFENVEHTQCTLPSSVNKKLQQFMTCLGLNYGAIDMIETPDGQFYFLEVNPSGQWDWISKLANLPIAPSVSRMLLSYTIQ